MPVVSNLEIIWRLVQVEIWRLHTRIYNAIKLNAFSSYSTGLDDTPRGYKKHYILYIIPWSSISHMDVEVWEGYFIFRGLFIVNNTIVDKSIAPEHLIWQVGGSHLKIIKNLYFVKQKISNYLSICAGSTR